MALLRVWTEAWKVKRTHLVLASGYKTTKDYFDYLQSSCCFQRLRNVSSSTSRSHSTVVSNPLDPTAVLTEGEIFPTPPPPPGYDNCDADDGDAVSGATLLSTNFDDDDAPKTTKIRQRQPPPKPPTRTTPPIVPPKPQVPAIHSVLECNSLKKNSNPSKGSNPDSRKNEPCSPVKDVESTL